MREHEYRAWYAGKMIYKPELEWCKSKDKYMIRLLDDNGYVLATTYYEDERFHLMQYLGLYGIGKAPRQKIYEGDIVQVQTSSGMFTGEVRYSTLDGYCLVWPYEWPDGDMGKVKEDSIPIAGMAYYGFVILGNIHEQPTLLKELHVAEV